MTKDTNNVLGYFKCSNKILGGIQSKISQDEIEFHFPGSTRYAT